MWALIGLAVGLVLVAEMANTAIETLADRLHPGQHPEIGVVRMWPPARCWWPPSWRSWSAWPICCARRFSVLNYSTSASLSARPGVVPNSRPWLPLPVLVVSIRVPTCFAPFGHEAHLHRIKYVVAPPEGLGAVGGQLQQIAQGRHRAVVQVGAAKPDAVEEGIL